MGNVALLVFYCHRVCTRLDLNERREKERKKKKKRVADRFHHVRQGRNILTGPVMYSPLSLSGVCPSAIQCV